MIVTLTLNPAIDKSIAVERLIAEKKMRCAAMQVDAGGGGINISKAIHELGGTSTAVYTCGGTNGGHLTRMLLEKGIPVQPVEIEGETRESFVVNEKLTNKQYRFVLPGPTIAEKELKRIEQTIDTINNVTFLVFSGSLPPGLSSDFMGRLGEMATKRGIKFIADTSGEPLKAALQNGAYLLKPSLTELCLLAGKDYLEPAEIKAAAERILSNGRCEVLVVSMGPAGAMLVTKNKTELFTAPAVKKISTVGAGDSMVAGIVWMLEKGKRLEEAVQFGVACGTAATINSGTQLFKKEDAIRFYEWMKEGHQPSVLMPQGA
ncbi:MAG: 1-phosphofructokinase family hexose kinase [Flavisolibacter sp.]